jgi:hypothetical protein
VRRSLTCLRYSTASNSLASGRAFLFAVGHTVNAGVVTGSGQAHAQVMQSPALSIDDLAGLRSRRLDLRVYRADGPGRGHAEIRQKLGHFLRNFLF